MDRSKRNNASSIILLVALIIIAASSVSFTSVDFAAPTISDNATTNMNWTYINITSNENLSQARLEWGNASEYTNYSMDNTSASMNNWYYNMTNIIDGTYNYTIWTQNWTQNATGNWSQTERRFITFDTVAPYNLYACQDLDIENGSYVLAQNVSSAGTCFNILANNVTIDGAGYMINYSQSIEGYAINNTEGYDNIIIKNLNIVQGNNSIPYSEAIYGLGMNNSVIENNNITTSGTASPAIFIASYFSGSNIIANNTLTTLGNQAEGIRLESQSDSNIISNNAITTSMFSSIGIYLISVNSNIVTDNRITTSGSDGYGVYLLSSNSNTLSNNTITTLGPGGYGALLHDSSNSNNLTNNAITTTNTSAYSVYILSSSNNSISGGSIISTQSATYNLQNTSTTNNFISTNFTSEREIYFADTTSYFTYNNDSAKNIWLKTNVSNASYITRTLINWNNTLMQWNDTNSTAGIIVNYTIIGMQSTSIYLIYNTSAGVEKNLYNLTTDASGNLPSFNISLNGNTEIKAVYYGAYVAPTPAPTCSDGIQNGDETGTDCGGSCSACTSGSSNIITSAIRLNPSNNPITKVDVALKTLATNPILSVTKVSSISFGAPSGIIYQYVDISKNNFDNLDIEMATIDFRVNISWITANKISSIYLSRYDGGWSKLATNLTNSTESYNSYRAQTPGFSYFAIIGLAAASQFTPTSPPEQPSQPTADNNHLTERSNLASGTDNTTNTREAPKEKSYLWIIMLIAAVIIFIGVAFYFIERKKIKNNPQEIEINKQAQQKLIDPQIASEYINSRKKVFEDAETEYLIEKLKEAKKQIQ